MTQMVDIFAFPTPEYVEMANQTWGGEPVRHQIVSSGGMTLRDWFAGQAPVTLFDAAVSCGWDSLEAANMPKDEYRTTLWAVMTLMRYEYADAMLAAREQKA